jgi:hypothetical protein
MSNDPKHLNEKPHLDLTLSDAAYAGAQAERERILIYLHGIDKGIDALGPPALHYMLRKLIDAIQAGEHLK